MAGEVGHPSQVASIFAGHATRREVWRCPEDDILPICLTLFIAAFSWSNWE